MDKMSAGGTEILVEDNAYQRCMRGEKRHCIRAVLWISVAGIDALAPLYLIQIGPSRVKHESPSLTNTVV